MPRRSVEGRQKARRGSVLRLPEMREALLRLVVHVVGLIETDAGRDKGNNHPDHVAVPNK